MERFLWICLGGAAGTGARYLVGAWALGRWETEFPWGTLIVNVAGCFLIGLVMHVAANVVAFPDTLRLALTTGFLGGFTTYSNFGYETTRLWAGGTPRAALVNFGLTTLLGFVAVILGSMAGNAFVEVSR